MNPAAKSAQVITGSILELLERERRADSSPARHEHGFAGTRRSGDPGDRSLAACVKKPEQPVTLIDIGKGRTGYLGYG